MPARDSRDAHQWLLRHLGLPVAVVLMLVAMTAAIAREAAAGPIPHPSSQPFAMHAGSASLVAPSFSFDLHIVQGLGHPPAVAAATGFVFDADTGAVYYTNHAGDERAMASCTKIMTALVAVQHAALSQTITISRDAAALVNPDNSYMGVSAGEQLSLEELLYGLLLPSGNDAAVAIADAIGGSEAHFVAMMNQEAQSLGLSQTHFANPHGLDAPGHYTSARDLAVLAAVALRDPTISRIAATPHYTIARTATHKAFNLSNYNSLLPGGGAPYPGAVGLKPGNTGAAGWCEAFAARRDGHLIVGVVLGDPTWSQRNADMHALLNWGFAQEGVAPGG